MFWSGCGTARITFNSVLAAATQLGRWEEVMPLLEEVDAWQGKAA